MSRMGRAMKSLNSFTWQQSKKNLLAENLPQVYRVLRSHFGFQNWWPGETPFEVIVGAILTQNTSWTNVERAIAVLKKNHCLTPEAMQQVSVTQLAVWIRSAGYFNIKARRLKSFLHFLFAEFSGNLEEMFRCEEGLLRQKLLAVNGIGPETADSILLYAGDVPFFVIDAYTRRIFTRHALSLSEKPNKRVRSVLEKMNYHEWQVLFQKSLPKDVKLWNDFHAQIVMLAKTYCKSSTWSCSHCPLLNFL